MKKCIVILLSVLTMAALTGCGSAEETEEETPDEETEEIISADDGTEEMGESDAGDWSDSEIASYLPKPDASTIQVTTDEADYFGFTVTDASQDDFDVYVSQCQYMGFTEDVDSSSSAYTATNDDGLHEIHLTYQADEESYEGYIVPAE